MKKNTPTGQFFVECVEGSEGLVPVDNFLWKTARGEIIRLSTTASKIYVTNGNRIEEAWDVPEALRLMADILERKARNKH